MNIISFAHRLLNRESPGDILQKYGYEALDQINAINLSSNMNLVPIFGTLLGTFREHSFIPYDDDLDIALNIEHISRDLLDTLEKHGFELHHLSIASDFKGCLLSMRYKGIISEIYFAYKQNEKYVFYTPKPVRGEDWAYSALYNICKAKEIEIPEYSNYIDSKMGPINIRIPSNTSEILKAVYGDNFMTPVKNAHANPDTKLYPIEEKFFRTYPIEFCLENDFLDILRRKGLEQAY